MSSYYTSPAQRPKRKKACSLSRPSFRKPFYFCHILLTTLSSKDYSGPSMGWETHGACWELLHDHSAKGISTESAAKQEPFLQLLCHGQRCFFFLFPSFEGSTKSPSLILQESSVLPSPRDLGTHGPFYALTSLCPTCRTTVGWFQRGSPDLTDVCRVNPVHHPLKQSPAGRDALQLWCIEATEGSD